MTDAAALLLPPEERQELWSRLVAVVETYLRDVGKAPVAAETSADELRNLLAGWDFSEPVAAVEALDFAADSLWRYQVHTPHPRYFGLFNPAPATMGIAADALVAAFNPQLAAWSHSPFANDVEQHRVARCPDARLPRGRAARAAGPAQPTVDLPVARGP